MLVGTLFGGKPKGNHQISGSPSDSIRKITRVVVVLGMRFDLLSHLRLPIEKKLGPNPPCFEARQCSRGMLGDERAHSLGIALKSSSCGG